MIGKIGVILVVLLTVNLLVGSGAAWADSSEVPEALLEDLLINELTYADAAASTSCTYESILTGPNAEPSDRSFQLVYALPSDAIADKYIDVPRSCESGAIIPSRLAKSSRNAATYQDAQNAGIHFRVINGVYGHNFTGEQYSTRAVRRYRTSRTMAEWDAMTPEQKLDNLADDLANDGWNVPKTRYSILLHSHANQTSCGVGCTSTTYGWASIPGVYSLSLYLLPSTKVKYGCDTIGDVVALHELVHNLGVDHTTDSAYDLMNRPVSDRTFRSTNPALYWDYQNNDYYSPMQETAYAIQSELAGTLSTC